jgi:hypothetical protein
VVKESANLAGNYVGGKWQRSQSSSALDVINPATSESLARIALAEAGDVAAAVEAAAAAFPAWRRTPPQERIQYLFRFRQLLQSHSDEIARLTTLENGKTLAEARAELQRGIENVEVACGIPTLMQGYNLEDVAGGIDEIMIRQPLGVTAAITPFNFPAMIPLWMASMMSSPTSHIRSASVIATIAAILVVGFEEFLLPGGGFRVRHHRFGSELGRTLEPGDGHVGPHALQVGTSVRRPRNRARRGLHGPGRRLTREPNRRHRRHHNERDDQSRTAHRDLLLLPV